MVREIDASPNAGDFSAAIEDAQRELALDPKELATHEWIADLHFRVGQFGTSLLTCEAALKIEGSEWSSRDMYMGNLHFRAARALYELGRYAEALSHLTDLFPGYELPSRVKDPLLTRRGLVKACKAKIAQK